MCCAGYFGVIGKKVMHMYLLSCKIYKRAEILCSQCIFIASVEARTETQKTESVRIMDRKSTASEF